jgi:hypothetical protein
MLRKMVSGPRGRVSAVIDFACRSDIAPDDLAVTMPGVFNVSASAGPCGNGLRSPGLHGRPLARGNKRPCPEPAAFARSGS